MLAMTLSEDSSLHSALYALYPSRFINLQDWFLRRVTTGKSDPSPDLLFCGSGGGRALKLGNTESMGLPITSSSSYYDPLRTLVAWVKGFVARYRGSRCSV
ncbi:hypothetical protein U1Q18_002292 [Sarracenia purpurea var. burkii]